MTAYTEFHFYSPILDQDAVRLSVWDAKGSEFFRIITFPEPGKSYRKARDDALGLIIQAIQMGLEPGEVITHGDF